MIQWCQPLSRVISFEGRGTKYGRRNNLIQAPTINQSQNSFFKLQAHSTLRHEHNMAWFGLVWITELFFVHQFMHIRNIMKVEMGNTSRKTWENEMRIGRVTKWGLGGWHECPATATLGEMWRLTMVSERTEICMNSKSTHSASSIAKWLCWKASKSNFPVLRVLCTQPTSWKWVGEPDYPARRWSISPLN